VALDRLLDELSRRAGAEIAAVQDASRREAAALIADAEQRVAERRRASLSEREGTLRAAADRAVAAAEHDQRRAELEARRRLVDRALAAAAERLPDVAAGAEFRDRFPAHLVAALECLTQQAGTLRCTPALLEDARRLAAGRAGLTVMPDPDVRAGFVLESVDGRVAIDGTLDGMLARDRAALALAVMRAVESAP
jgi:vacuolar-type H+-ATPase subunit E/Vma4